MGILKKCEVSGETDEKRSVFILKDKSVPILHPFQLTLKEGE